MRITGIPDLNHVALQRLALGMLPKAAAIVEPVAPIPPAAPVHPQVQTSVAMLVAIASIDPEAHRRRSTAAAEKGLKALERLHDALRCGSPGPAQLRAIAAWMDDHSAADGAEAADLLREVELRVLVELAKAERDA